MRPTKTSHTFDVKGEQVRFSSNFDSGNLRTVTQLAANEFLIESSLDSYQIQVSQKSFFHFSVHNYPLNELLIMNIPSLSLLACIRKDCLHKYQPCFSTNGQQYHRVPKQCVKIIQKQENIVLKISFLITHKLSYFAFSLPYSYERYLNMVRDLPNFHPDFYIKKQVLCYSKNLNLVYMITITSFNRQTDQQDNIGSINNGVILPEKHIDSNRIYFDKPVILISARVHPGQSPSSWAIEGIINFLIGNSQKAKILRQNFQMVIVPMLNPDGVYEGMYRLDTMGHNLNRYYLISDNRQPSIYSMKHLIKHYDSSKRLLYYFDFHGHPSFKGSFMYGNAIDEIAYQAETQLFGRLMSLKCKTFEQKYCIFDREQMSSKDRFDMYTKEGCARVYAFKIANILHSYTIEMGFHACTDFNGDKQGLDSFIYDKEAYYLEGVAVLESVLESCGLQTNHNCKKLRQQIATQILIREERFRKEDKNAGKKRKNVNEIVQKQYWKPIKNKFFQKLTETKTKLFTKQHTPKSLRRDSSTKFEIKTNSRENLSSEIGIRDNSVKPFNIKTPTQKANRIYFVDKDKHEMEAKFAILNFRNRKFIYDSLEYEAAKQVPKIELKTMQAEEKKVEKVEKRKFFERKKSKYLINRSQESMFSDNNLRDDGTINQKLTQNRIKKAKFSIIADEKINPQVNEIKQIFKLQKIDKLNSLSNRRSVQPQRFNSVKL